LDDAGSEVVDVAPETLDGVAQSIFSVGCLVDVILEDLVAAQESFQLVGVGVLVHAHTCGHEVLRLEGTVCDHREHVHNIMGQAVGVVVAVFTVVLHLELASSHLRDAVVHCLTCVYCGFEVCVFK